MSKLINREELLAKENLQEIAKELEADIALYNEELTGMDREALKKEEEELMDIFKANDEYVGGVEYELPDEIEYDGRKLKRNEITTKVVGFLNRIEVQFQATLGLYQCIRFWKTRGTGKIPYGAFDSTLRMLGTLKFKGEQDCFDILVVNNWFTAAHDAYSRDNIWTQYLHARHQSIMQNMEALDKADAPQAVAE
ncbi:MAG: hypothetical protein K2N48_14805 [Muribaculaceae bacterium]|nr:hypothetical protein [Muribaculaceae bacterium]